MLLLDPILATGRSVSKAIELLLEHGVKQERIVFLTLIASAEGVRNLFRKYPLISIVSTEIDDALDEEGKLPHATHVHIATYSMQELWAEEQEARHRVGAAFKTTNCR